jgi:DTW domain-containing protein YfiP
VVFVIDGTWNTVKKMLRLSPNILSLPRFCFTPPGLSNFKVRKQPAPECYSTIEAIHHTIELLGPSRGFSIAEGHHHHLLDVFGYMVQAQLRFIENAPEPAYRRVQKSERRSGAADSPQ